MRIDQQTVVPSCNKLISSKTECTAVDTHNVDKYERLAEQKESDTGEYMMYFHSQRTSGLGRAVF